MSSEPIRERVVLSPLRYPGGKRRLVPYVAAALAANDLRPDVFVEPFAGGASVALELLATDEVQSIGLAELDPYVASFWETVFFDTDWLCRQVASIEVSLDAWRRMKSGRFRSRRSQALACLYLNRTSFNGTLHPRAGPIGGMSQSSGYPIDCRFPRERLVRRIRMCAQFADRVAFIRHEDALGAVAYARRRLRGKSLFYYFDPPFWAKSSFLYRHAFTHQDHQRLATAVRYLREPYLLSYDPAPEVRELYAGRSELTVETVELLYTATQRTAESELVITNLRNLPADTRLWRTHAEWTQLRRRRGSVRLAR